MSSTLEPISALIKLAILNYKQEGTKISINDNGIFFQEPYMYQGLLRYWYNDSRYDIDKLELLITKAIIWISVNLNSESYKKATQFIFKKCINGLLKLSKSYQKDAETYSLILRLSQIIQSFLYENIIPDISSPDLTDSNIDRAWKDKNDIIVINNSFHDIEKEYMNKRITDLDELYNKINNNLQSIETLLQRKDVLYISKIEDNNYLIK